MLKVIETFSGIGAQSKALQNIAKKNKNLKSEIVATVEWEIGAIVAYDVIKNGIQNLDKYENFSKQDIVNLLSCYNLSSNGKEPLDKKSLSRISISQLKSILFSIERNNNLVDITKVHADNLPNADLLTYSFPCQDLSIGAFLHGNFTGINRNANNRSGLLWEIERILKEYESSNKPKPRFLLMENVSTINGSLHKANFDFWKNELVQLGYTNHVKNLEATSFGIPQKRLRTFMLSILTDDLSEEKKAIVDKFFHEWDNKIPSKLRDIHEFLRLDYSNKKYLEEAIESTPNYTESRMKIHSDNVILAIGKDSTHTIAKTITTKQDRNPNAGIILHGENFGNSKAPFRYLTPRETFLLMGFDEKDFDSLMVTNNLISKSRKFLSLGKLLKLSGNSIVVTILEDIFERLILLQDTLNN